MIVLGLRGLDVNACASDDVNERAVDRAVRR
jgi:hypothetical protein